MLIDPEPVTPDSPVQIRCFRKTETTGEVAIRVHKGDNTTTENARIAGNGDTYLAADNGNIGLGTALPDPAYKVDAVGAVRVSARIRLGLDPIHPLDAATKQYVDDVGGGGSGGGSADGWMRGVTIAYATANSVQLVPSDDDGVAQLSLYDGSDWLLFEATTTKTATFVTSGVGGLDTGAEAASTFYHLWAIGKDDGTLSLLLSLSATTPTMPAGYTFKGLVGGVANDASSDIVQFEQLSDGRFMYTGTQVDSVRGVNVLSGGDATSYTAIDLSTAIPDIPGCVYGLQVRAANNNSTNSVFSCSEDSAGTTHLFTDRTIGNTGSVVSVEHWEIEARNTGSRVSSLYYKWSVSTANLDADVFIKWFIINGVLGGGGGSGGSGHTIQDEGTPLTTRSAINFIGAGVTTTDDSSNDRTTVSIPGAHIIQDEGTTQATRGKLNFAGAGVTVSDDSGSDRTVVTIPGGTGGHTIQDEGTPLTARTGLNFIGANVAVTDDSGNNRTNVTISGSGHTIQEEGTPLTSRANLNFAGAGVTATDDSVNSRTLVTIPGAHLIQDEGSNRTQRSKLNFAGAGVAVTDDSGNDATLVTVTSGGHTVQDEGTPLTTRANLNFAGSGVAVSDDVGNNATLVTISGGAGSSVVTADSGYSIAYNNANSVNLVPDGPDSTARLTLYDGADWQLFETTVTKTASLASSGAGGLDAGSEAASTFYYLWAIGKTDGTLALLLSINSTSPTMPAGYTFKLLIGGVANNSSSNIVVFDYAKSGWFQYRVANTPGAGIVVLTGFTSTTNTVINLINAVPNINGIEVGVYVKASNTNTGSGQSSAFYLKHDSTNTDDSWIRDIVGGTANPQIYEDRFPIILHNGASGSVQAKWGSNLGTRSALVSITGFNLGRIVGGGASSGGSGGTGHTIEDEGTPLTSRTYLNFVGSGVAVTDDSGNDRTVVTISGGGGGISDGDKGDITVSGSGATWTVDPDAITNSKLADVATATFKGRTTAGTGDPEDLTVSQAKALLNLTGTNSGDQTIALTGDVTGSGTGSFATTVANDAVSNAKLANVATATFKGRTTAGTGDPEDLTISQAKTLLNLTGTNSGDQTVTLTGDVTGSGTGSFAATIAADAVTYAKMQNVSAASKILGRGSASGSGNVEEIALGTNLAMSGTTLNATGGGHTIEDEGTPLTARTNLNFVGAGVAVTDDSGNNATVVTISGTGLADGDMGDITVSGSGTVLTVDPDAITNAKLANVATATFKGRTTAGTGDPEDLTTSQAKTLLGLTGTNSGDQTITLTGDVTGSGTGSFAATIASDAVTNPKLADVPTATFKGRTTAGTGDPEDLTVSQAKTLLNLAGTNTGDQTVTLTGDVTGSGTGSFAATIANDSVGYAKMQNVSAASKILGRGSASGSGDVEEITLGTNLSMSGTTLNASGGGTGHTIQDEGTPLTSRSNLNFIGAGVTVTDNSGAGATDVTIAGASGHTIQDEGSGLTARTNLNFVGAGVTVTDDSGNNASVVTIPGGATTLATADGAYTITYNSASTVDMVPSGPDLIAKLTLYDGTDWKLFQVASTKSASLAASGAGGLDTGSEAANTFYCLWAIGKSDDTFDLLLSLSASTPTMPSGYTFKLLISGVSNSEGASFNDIMHFVHDTDGSIRYTGHDEATVNRLGPCLLAGGTATTPTAVDLSKGVPNVPGVKFVLECAPSNTNATNSAFRLSKDSSGATTSIIWNSNLNSGGAQKSTDDAFIPWTLTGGLATSVYYHFTVSVTVRSADIYVSSFKLGNVGAGTGGDGSSAVISVTSTTATADGGFSIAYNSASTVDMVPSGVDVTTRLTLYDGSAWKLFQTGSTKSASLASSGVAGLDTGAEAASTFYYLWAIGKPDGTLGLLLSVASASPTMPSGYTFKLLIGGVANDASSNITQFDYSSSGWFQYRVANVPGGGVSILSAFTATTDTAADLTPAVPNINGTEIGIFVRASNTNSTAGQASNLYIKHSSTNTDDSWIREVVGGSVNGQVYEDRFMMVLHNGASGSVLAKWSAALGTRAGSLGVTGFRLRPRNVGGGGTSGVTTTTPDTTGVSGVKLTRSSASQLQLVPSDDDGKARIGMYDGSVWQCYTIVSTQTADITTSGANGLDTGSEASSTFYHLWAIGKSDGTFALLLSLSATSPTMPTGYTFKRLLGGDRNDSSGDFCVFDHLRDGWQRYRITNTASGGISILSAGSSTTDVALDLTGTVPNLTGIQTELYLTATNSNVSAGQSSSYRLKYANANANDILLTQPLGGGGFTQTINDRIPVTVHSALNTSLYYQWTANGTRSLSVSVTGFNIGIGWSGSGGGSALNFSDDDTITGTIDGVNDTFTLAHAPNPAASLMMNLNGILLKRAVGYVLSGATLTMQSGYIPAPGAVLSAFFRY